MITGINIHPLHGEFADPTLERQYRASVQADTARYLRTSLLVCGILYFAFLLVDLQLVTSSRQLFLLGLMRIGIVSLFLLLSAGVWLRPALVENPLPLNAVLFCLGSAVMLAVPLRPETLSLQITGVMVVLTAIYLFIPNRIPWMIGQAAWLSLAFLMVVHIWADRPLSHVGMLALLLLLPNIIGLMTAQRLNRLQREQFLALLDARNANLKLLQEITERERLEDGLRQLAQTDELTKLNNRRSFDELAAQALRQARRTGSPLTVCMVDLDFFKDINDTYGHPAGDKVLAAVAEVCRDQLRESDIIGRYGGEEFVVALPNTDAYSARLMAERLRARIEDHRFAGELASLRLTVTAGVSQVRPDEDTLDPALVRADEALYEGKREGRNRVALAA